MSAPQPPSRAVMVPVPPHPMAVPYSFSSGFAVPASWAAMYGPMYKGGPAPAAEVGEPASGTPDASSPQEGAPQQYPAHYGRQPPAGMGPGVSAPMPYAAVPPPAPMQPGVAGVAMVPQQMPVALAPPYAPGGLQGPPVPPLTEERVMEIVRAEMRTLLALAEDRIAPQAVERAVAAAKESAEALAREAERSAVAAAEKAAKASAAALVEEKASELSAQARATRLDAARRWLAFGEAMGFVEAAVEAQILQKLEGAQGEPRAAPKAPPAAVPRPAVQRPAAASAPQALTPEPVATRTYPAAQLPAPAQPVSQPPAQSPAQPATPQPVQQDQASDRRQHPAKTVTHRSTKKGDGR